MQLLWVAKVSQSFHKTIAFWDIIIFFFIDLFMNQHIFSKM